MGNEYKKLFPIAFIIERYMLKTIPVVLASPARPSRQPEAFEH
jgi:hypothetical protein